MPAVRNLNELLRSMKPKLMKGEYVFCTIPEKSYMKLNVKPVLIFREKEGITILINKKIAEKHKFSYTDTWAMITLQVHSDLSAIGFLATITNALARHAIPVNVVSAYYHDHLFVPTRMAKNAMKILKNLSKSYASSTLKTKKQNKLEW
jgi:hypothetical protein